MTSRSLFRMRANPLAGGSSIGTRIRCKVSPRRAGGAGGTSDFGPYVNLPRLSCLQLVADFAVGAHLEAAVGRARRHRGDVPARAVVGESTSVEAPRDVRVREGADQPFGDPEALPEGEGRIGRLGLETVGVLESPTGRREAASPKREEAELQEGIVPTKRGYAALRRDHGK